MNDVTEATTDAPETLAEAQSEPVQDANIPEAVEMAAAVEATAMHEVNSEQSTAESANSEQIDSKHPSPAALFKGQAILELPQDLYIPPEALRVFLEAFQGPLDLLLYLIKKNNIDILDIPIAQITEQYVEYIELMQEMRFELAAEYLLMAASLAEIKSRMLLPRIVNEEGEEEDPRAELIRRLQEYERFKKAAEDLDTIPRVGRDIFPVTNIDLPEHNVEKPLPDVNLPDLISALRDIMRRAEITASHHVKLEPLSVRERMTAVLSSINATSYTDFVGLFDPREGKLGVVVTFIAILELLKNAMIELIQAEPYSPIYVKAVANDE